MALNAGQSESISASGQAADNSGVTASFSYSSSAQAVATVSSAGKVIGLSAGTTTITVTGTAGAVTKSATVAVTISGQLPNAVTVVAGAETNDFTPRDVAIARGGAVTWTFPGTTHNVDFGGAAGAPANIGNTGNSNAGITRSFANAGTFSYVCSLHSGMGGSVLVP
jgi:plastocyanin